MAGPPQFSVKEFGALQISFDEDALVEYETDRPSFDAIFEQAAVSHAARLLAVGQFPVLLHGRHGCWQYGHAKKLGQEGVNLGNPDRGFSYFGNLEYEDYGMQEDALFVINLRASLLGGGLDTLRDILSEPLRMREETRLSPPRQQSMIYTQPCEAAPLTGQRVVLCELESRRDLNGRRGLALSYSTESDRYTIELDALELGVEGGELMALRPANLSVVANGGARSDGADHSDGTSGPSGISTGSCSTEQPPVVPGSTFSASSVLAALAATSVATCGTSLSELPGEELAHREVDRPVEQAEQHPSVVPGSVTICFAFPPDCR
jgi:hypothetical protein